MKPANPSEVTLFEAALEHTTPEARAAYLDQACAGQPELRRRIEGLLAAYDRSDNFLERPAANNQPTIRLALAPEESPGTVIGRYKLLQKIGEGGMGVVYMAEQTEPVIRKVAFKIIKLGMDTRQVVARFEAERQALALMDHPNIAKILDAGVTGAPLAAGILPTVEPGFQPGGPDVGVSKRAGMSGVPPIADAGPGGKMPPSTAGETPAATLSAGRPYFVMELVHGVPITEYCDKNKLSTQQRLELFIPVCQAIQHAHQKGIIHRDIKPSNVMVTLHDGVPVPKVIDFGVAKATNQRLTEKTLFTHYAQMIGTPAYMSPEQAEMSGLDIDTRSDIYSLGVLLYELLTGSTPFDAKELLSKGYAEMQRIIAEQEPVKPSTRMSTLEDKERTVVASNRSMGAAALRRVLQGDLDWIVMKCLEKDRTRRYETSNGLAADLHRHLNNELISARPPTTGYLLRKLIRRNKVAFASGSSVAAALVVGLALATWQAFIARQAEYRAKEAEGRALATVDELRSTAPAFAEQARALVAQSKFDEAITKLDYALKLRPDVADYLVLKANLLQCQFKLAEAADVYRAALKLKPDYGRAPANLKLTEELLAAQSANGGKLSTENLARLQIAMQAEQRSAAELLPVSQRLGQEKEVLLAYWLERLADLSIAADKPLKDRLRLAESGRLTFDLSNTSISDLSPLGNMPLGELSLTNCRQVSDLTPLRGLPLRTLRLNNTRVHDLSPLKEVPTIVRLDLNGTPVSDLAQLMELKLQFLDLTGCKVTDLSPLSGMPLAELRLRSTQVTSLAPLRGMPLRMLDLTYVPARDFEALSGLPLQELFLQDIPVNDLSFLKDMPLKKLSLWNAQGTRGYQVLAGIKTLEILLLPADVFSLPEAELLAIDALQQHPALQQIDNQIQRDLYFGTSTAPKEVFWRRWNADRAMVDGRYAEAQALLAATMKEAQRSQSELHPATLDAIRRLAKCEACLGNYRAAAKLLRTELDAQIKRNGPQGLEAETGQWLSMGAAQLAAGDKEGYRRTCAETAERFQVNPRIGFSETAIRLIRLWSFAPNSGVSDLLLKQKDETARTGAPNFYLISAALMELRAGNWDKAETLLSGPINWHVPVAYRDLMLAMIHHHRGNLPEARGLITQIRERGIASWPPLKTEPASEWWDLLFLHLFLEEATQAIEGSPAATGAAGSTRN